MTNSSIAPKEANDCRQRLRHSLILSQKDSFASSIMTGSYDQYVNAYAVFLGATAVQIGWLTALPQLLGGLIQFLTIWLGQWVRRHRLIIAGAMLQIFALVVICLTTVPAGFEQPLVWLLGAIAAYHVGGNLVMPHWRAWMGILVPDRLRGRFFARRNHIAMLTSFITFFTGGWLLHWVEPSGRVWLGFLLLFVAATLGRAGSVLCLAHMHDPHPPLTTESRQSLAQLFTFILSLWHDRDFRRFTLFLAGMQGFVALSGPFFAIYMLRDLGFSYLAFMFNTGASILVQFLMLPAWGKVCDAKGNRYVMAVCALVIPVLPMLWLVSDSRTYLIFVQMLSGLVWSGFSLASANYLYDLKPRHTHFARYCALHSFVSALAICAGALAGGYLIDWIPASLSMLGISLEITRPIAVIFILSSLLRVAVALWYLPSASEVRLRNRGRVRDLVFRIARFTPISGVVLDVINDRKK